jgi:hypothetical protein
LPLSKIPTQMLPYQPKGKISTGRPLQAVEWDRTGPLGLTLEGMMMIMNNDYFLNNISKLVYVMYISFFFVVGSAF